MMKVEEIANVSRKNDVESFFSLNNKVLFFYFESPTSEYVALVKVSPEFI